MRNERHAREDREQALSDIHGSLNKLTTRQVFDAMNEPSTLANRSFLKHLHERLVIRAEVLNKYVETNDQLDDTDADIGGFLKMIDDRLSEIRGAISECDPQPNNDQKPQRDFTKYSWHGTSVKHGKGAMLNLIGAAFARDRRITSLSEFTEQFGVEVQQAVRAIAGSSSFEQREVVSPLLFEGQRDRYATANLRWRDTYGDEGVMELDGNEYLVAWDLGIKRSEGVTTAGLQKAVIEHFARLNPETYPAVEMPRR